MPRSYIGIDIGGTWIKAARLPDGEVRYEPYPNSGKLEDVLFLVKKLISPCDGIFICAQMGCSVLNGRITSWKESIPEKEWDALRFQGENCELRNSSPVCWAAFWRKIHKLEDGDPLPRSFGDAVAFELTSVPNHWTHITNASATGGMVAGSYVWDEALFKAFGIKQLAEKYIATNLFCVGYYHGIPIYLPVGDMQCAVLGTDLQPDELSINIGTGAQISMLGTYADSCQIRPYFGRLLNCVTHLPGGRRLEALAALLQRPLETLERDLPPETETKVDLSLGHIYNLDAAPSHIYLAALKNICEKFFEAYCRLPYTREVKRLVFSGGVLEKSPRLRELLAEKFILPTRLVTNATMKGLYTLACGVEHAS